MAAKAEDLARLDRRRKDKFLSNKDWRSPDDPEAKVAKRQEGRAHLACNKPEHAVDLDNGASIAAGIHEADRGGRDALGQNAQGLKRRTVGVAGLPNPRGKA